MDDRKIEEAVRLFLEGIGEDVNREGLLETPARVARMCHQIYGGLEQNPGEHLLKQFDTANDNMVVEKDIPFYSTCEHHLLPFFGKAHVAYIPNGKVAGLSKLARTVEGFARRAQIQENMTAQIADAMEEYLKPKGVMVMLEAEHLCMTMRGIQKPGTKTVTMMVRGAFAEDFQLQQTFLQLASDLRQIRTGLSLYNTDGIPKGRRRDLKIPRCRLPLSVKLIVRKFFCQILFCGDIPHPHFVFFKVPIYGYILPLGLIYQGAAIGSAIPWPIFLIIRRILTALGRLIETIEHALDKLHQSRLP